VSGNNLDVIYDDTTYTTYTTNTTAPAVTTAPAMVAMEPLTGREAAYTRDQWVEAQRQRAMLERQYLQQELMMRHEQQRLLNPMTHQYTRERLEILAGLEGLTKPEPTPMERVSDWVDKVRSQRRED
jgi:hypothetical protein